MTAGSPAGRRSLEDRLSIAAIDTGRDLQWVRRRHVFLRVLHRLAANAPQSWVLKGGFAVELRRPGSARATRDIDISLRTRLPEGVSSVDRCADLIDHLQRDVDGDGFRFDVVSQLPLADDAYGRPAWRVGIDAVLAGKSFVRFHLDVVDRPDELVEVTEISVPPGAVVVPGFAPRVVAVTDLRQQFAEKLHALSRTYLTGESTRVRDLVDMVLLIEDGLRGDKRLNDVVIRVFAVRGTGDPPDAMGPPPAAWRLQFDRLADETGLSGMSLEAAGAVVADVWSAACRAAERKED